MKKLPWIAEVRRVEGGEFPFISCASHEETGARVYDASFSALEEARRSSIAFAAQINAMKMPVYEKRQSSECGEVIEAFRLTDSAEGMGFDYEEIPIESIESITPEALEAAGWTRSELSIDRYELPPSEVYGPELTIWRVGGEGPHEITVYCDDASQNVRIGYALTMSEVNAIAAVAKRTWC